MYNLSKLLKSIISWQRSSQALGLLIFLLAACDGKVTVPNYDLKTFYNAPSPELDLVIPKIGSPLGGEIVKLQGKNFKEGIKVTFGEASCEVVSVNDTEVSCKTSKYKEGPARVTAINLDGKLVTKKDAFISVMFLALKKLSLPTAP